MQQHSGRIRPQRQRGLRIADHGFGVDDAVEVGGRNAERERCLAERGAFIVGLVCDRGGLVVDPM
jgi:hypothetical protein